jgi:AraC-like DNA-binding protein
MLEEARSIPPVLSYTLPTLYRLSRRLVSLDRSFTVRHHRIQPLALSVDEMLSVDANHLLCVHAHGFFECHLVLAGEMEMVESAGRRPPVGEGGTILLAPHTPHAWRITRMPCVRCVVSCQIEPRLAITSPTTWPVIPAVLDELARLFHTADIARPGWQERATAHGLLLLSQVLAHYGWPPDDDLGQQTTDDRAFLTTIDQLLASHLDRQLSLTEVAECVTMSVTHLTRTFRRLTGMTLMQHLTNYRLDLAAHWLTTTDLPIGAIAHRLGFLSQAYFSACFKRRAGLTPSVYRHRQRSFSVAKERTS